MFATTVAPGPSHPVVFTTVAYDVGYNSPSAFTAMFRRAFGRAPTQYLASIPGGKPPDSQH